jgi:hypothetical protein
MLRSLARTSENAVNTKFAQCGFSALGPSFFDGTAPAEPGHIGQTVHTRGSAYATCPMPCNNLQHTDARDEALG